jgi:photoprotection regulator FRP-like protein
MRLGPRAKKNIARRAYDQAHAPELTALADEVRRCAEQITEPQHIWALHDFLTQKRKEIDQKYDYRYSQLVFVFARLIRDEWLSEDELAGLGEEKLAKIRAWLEL